MQDRLVPEPEPKPKVLITFRGFLHFQNNLQGIPNIGNNLQTHIERSSGRSIVLIEGAGNTETEARRINDGTKIYGQLGNFTKYMLETQGRSSDKASIHRAITAISTMSLRDIFENNAIPVNMLFTYHLAQILDQLHAQYGFTPTREFHPKSTLERLARLSSERNALNTKTWSEWANGKLDEAVETRKLAINSLQQSCDIRDAEIVENLKPTIRRLLKENGSLFLLFGPAHIGLLEIIKQKFPNTPITFDSSEPPSKYGSVLRLPNAEERTEIDYARDLLADIILGQLDQLVAQKWRQKAVYYSQNFESVFGEVEKTVRSLTLEQIRAMCENKQDALKVVKDHAASEEMKMLFAR